MKRRTMASVTMRGEAEVRDEVKRERERERLERKGCV